MISVLWLLVNGGWGGGGVVHLYMPHKTQWLRLHVYAGISDTHHTIVFNLFYLEFFFFAWLCHMLHDATTFMSSRYAESDLVFLCMAGHCT